MQKKIIALAVAGLVSGGAFAQSNVTISGKVQAGYENYKISDAANQSAENRISDQSSRIIFSGNESLGSGLTAVWQVDTRFSIDQTGGATGVPNGFGTGNTFMGIRSDSLGLLAIGHADVHYGEFGAIEGNRAGSLQANIGAGLMSQVNGAAIAVTSRANNLLWWDSPNWNGITARVGYSFGHGTEGTGAFDGDNGSATTMALRYNNGPLTGGMSYWRYEAENMTTATVPVNVATGAFNTAQTNNAAAFAGPAAKQRSTRAWVGYTMANVKVGLGWDQSKTMAAATGNETKRSAWMIPVSYTMGNNVVYFTYARAGNTSGSAVAAGSDAKANAYVLGFDHGLSKRTSVGAFLTKVNNKGANAAYNMFGLSASGAQAAAASQDAKQIYLGMTHSF